MRKRANLRELVNTDMTTNDLIKLFCGSDGTSGNGDGGDDGSAEPKNEPSHKPTDEEAKLLKEVMQKKETIKKQEAEIAEIKGQLDAINQLGGIEALKKLAEEQAKMEAERRAAEQKKLEEKGEWEKLKAQMAEEHEKATAGYKQQIKDLESKIQGENAKIAELTVGSAFSASEYLKSKTILPPNKARALFGAYFDIAEDGKVIGYDKPRGTSGRTQLVDQSGNPLAFEAAIEKIISSDPDSEAFIRAPGKNGAGSGTTGGSETKKPEQNKAQSSIDMIRAGLKNLK